MNMLMPIEMGQQLYPRCWESTGVDREVDTCRGARNPHGGNQLEALQKENQTRSTTVETL